MVRRPQWCLAAVAGGRLPSFGSGPFGKASGFSRRFCKHLSWVKDGLKIDLKMLNVGSRGQFEGTDIDGIFISVIF